MLAYPCLDFKGKITYSRHLKLFILLFRAFLFQMAGGRKAKVETYFLLTTNATHRL